MAKVNNSNSKTMNVILLSLLSVAIFFAFAPRAAAAADCYNSSLNPITVCTCPDLNLTRNNLTAAYQLQNNVDCSGTVSWDGGSGFTPIGTNANRFKGSLNGQNFNITNLFINRTTLDYVGLFGIIDAGSNISNVGIMDVNISGHDRVGALVGTNFNGAINNSYSTGNITGDIKIGGLIGESYGNISNSWSFADVFSTSTSTAFTGGFVGYVVDGVINFSYAGGNVKGLGFRIGGFAGESDDTITFSYSTGRVNGSVDIGGLVGFLSGGKILNSYSVANLTSNSNAVGGLVGFMQSSSVINNSYARSNITVVGSQVGGLVGLVQTSSRIENSYATGNLTATLGQIGGLVGTLSSSTCLSSFWDNQTTGQGTSACGTGKTTSDLNKSGTFTNLSTAGLNTSWDFLNNPNNDTGAKNYWHISSTINNGYPFLTRFSLGADLDVTPPILAFGAQSTNAGAFQQNFIAANVTADDTNLSAITIYLYNNSGFVNSSNQSSSPFFINFTNLLEGIYYLNATANDTSGNIGLLAQVTITMDSTAPAVTLSGPSNSYYNDSVINASITFNCSATDNVGISNISLFITNRINASFSLNRTSILTGTSNSTNWTVVLANGNYTWNCLANDTAGNNAFASANFSILINYTDMALPSINLTFPPNNTNTSNNRITINYSASDSNLNFCWYSNNSLTANTTLANCANITAVTWSEGSHNVTVWANDTFRNIGFATITFNVDSIKPNLTILSPGNATNTTNNLININYTVSDINLQSCWYSNDSMTSNITISNCANITNVTWNEGSHNIKIWANDTYGNIANATLNFSVDTTPPAITILTPLDNSSTNNTRININYSASDIRLKLCWYSNDSMKTNISLSNCANITNVTWSEGDHNITVWANDSVGNVGNISLKITIDTVRPLVTIAAPSNNSNSSNAALSINYTASDSHLQSCWYSNDSMTSNITISNCANITNVTWSEGSHNVTVWVNDSAGNRNSSYVSFTIDSVIPSITILNPANTTNTTNNLININYTASDSHLQSCWYSNDSMTSNITISNCANITNVTWSEGSHNITIWANDSFGNKNSSSVSFTVDSTPPSVNLISPVNNTGRNNGSAIFIYNATDRFNVANCSLIINNAVNQTNLSVTMDILQNFTLNNLTAGKYNWTVNCTDSAGNIGTNQTMEVFIIPASVFSGATTDFSQVNITNITHLIVDLPVYGKLNFTETVDLTNSTDINSFINISFNRIALNSSAMPQLNKPAQLALYNLTFANPRLLRDGDLCPSTICSQISYSGGILVFNVTQFSTYSSEDTPSSSSSSSSSGSSGGSTGSSGIGGGGGVITEVNNGTEFTVSLLLGSNYTIFVKGESHKITITEMEENSARLLFYSKKHELTLPVGEAAYLDFDEDAVYDLSFKIVKVYGNRVEVEYAYIQQPIKNFSENIPIDEHSKDLPYQPSDSIINSAENIFAGNGSIRQESNKVLKKGNQEIFKLLRYPLIFIMAVLVAILVYRKINYY